jgi:hypothetical protein
MTNFMYAFYMHHSSSGRIDIFVHLFSNFTWIGLFHYLGFNLFIDLTYFYWLHVLGIDQYKINAFYLLLSTSTKSSNWRSSSRYFSFLIHMCYFGQKKPNALSFWLGACSNAGSATVLLQVLLHPSNSSSYGACSSCSRARFSSHPCPVILMILPLAHCYEECSSGGKGGRHIL